ncbi:MAG: LapA family protein [Solirubrobacterales bacterium]
MSDRAEGRGQGGGGISARQVLLGAVIVIALWFAITNSQKVEVDYIVGSAHSPLWLVIVISVLLGMVIDRSVAMVGRRRARRE